MTSRHLCKFCDTELNPLVVVLREVDDEARGPDLAWGCPGCNTLFEVFLADNPHEDDDAVVVYHDGYHPEEIPE